MDYGKIGTKMKENYETVAAEYRANDEQDALGPDHHRIAQMLSSICCSFDRPISILDIGCGTGRYFHCLCNAERLVGMDVSEAMLKQAQRPVRAEEVTAKHIELVSGNFYTADFPDQSFDFIYSIGVFGNGCSVTVDLCNRFARWLTPDGCVFFDAIDASSAPLATRARRRAKSIVYNLLPRSLQNAWDERSGWLPFFLTSQKHLERLIKRTAFRYMCIESHPYTLPLGPGRKLECFASKTPRRWTQPRLVASA